MRLHNFNGTFTRSHKCMAAFTGMILVKINFWTFLNLQHCHKFENLRDEVYCQLMKQTTSNKTDSCQRGWRLLSIVAAYFMCSETLRPFLLKYLETAAYDKRRAFHGNCYFESEKFWRLVAFETNFRHKSDIILIFVYVSIVRSILLLWKGKPYPPLLIKEELLARLPMKWP